MRFGINIGVKSVGAGTPTILLSDHFVGTQGSYLSQRVPPIGPQYEKFLSTVYDNKISNVVSNATPSNLNGINTADVGKPNFTVHVSGNVGAAGLVRIGRMLPAGGLQWTNRTYGLLAGFEPKTNSYRIVEYIEGVHNSRAAAPLETTGAQNYEFYVVLNGANITLYDSNGVQKITYTQPTENSATTVTGVGIHLEDPNSDYIDSITVYDTINIGDLL